MPPDVSTREKLQKRKMLPHEKTGRRQGFAPHAPMGCAARSKGCAVMQQAALITYKVRVRKLLNGLLL